MANFTNDFDVTTPPNTGEQPKFGAMRIREKASAIAERLGTMIYGFAADELDALLVGFKVLTFRKQASDPDTDATAMQEYVKEVDGKIEKFLRDGQGNIIQLTKNGKVKIDGAVAGTLPEVETKTGTTNVAVTNKLSDSTAEFEAADVGSLAHNTYQNTYALVTALDSTTLLSLDADIFPNGSEAYEIIKMPSKDNELATKVYVDRGYKLTSGMRSTKSADQNLGGLATTKIIFNVDTYDNLAEFAVSKFTAKMAGTYYIGVGIYYYGTQGTKKTIDNNISINNDTIHIYKNGANLYSIPALRLSAGASNYFEFNQIAQLATGDYIEIYITRPSSAAVTVVKSGVNGSVLTIQRVV